MSFALSLTFLLAGCSSTAPTITEPDGGLPDGGAAVLADAGPRPEDAAAAPDAGIDAGPADAGPPEGRCFEDVELVTLTGGREHVEPVGLVAHDGGWVALYEAFSHGGPSERMAAFLDREGRVVARQPLTWDYSTGGRAVLGRFLLVWQYDWTRFYEIGDGELIDRTDLLDSLPVGRIAAVERDGERLRILTSTLFDLTAGSFRYAYSEIELSEDGILATRTAELAPVETIGATALVQGLMRYHAFHSFAWHQDTLLFAYPTGEDKFEPGGHPWNMVRIALDRSRFERGEVSWAVIDQTRWERGPIAVFGALPDLDLAIAGRYDSRSGGEITAERFLDPAASPILLAGPGVFAAGYVGPAGVLRRGDMMGLVLRDRFRVLSVPAFEERASAPLELVNSIVAWGEDEVLELGSDRTADRVRGLVRCHELRPVP